MSAVIQVLTNLFKILNSIQRIMEIKYSNLENIELIVHGGFGSVYKAVWKDGPIVEDKQAWDLNKSEW
uniref:Protein kinase domain-containing protein n=1 Tax=Rhizophagus irregularis (strain DAOM 181602 / DAOM 197198 / MUCL 43194) TaxID=747089 RepID=U9UAC7_RHIID